MGGPSVVNDAPAQPSDVSLSPADATAATESLQSRMATCVLLLADEIRDATGVPDPPIQYKEGCKWGPVGIRPYYAGKVDVENGIGGITSAGLDSNGFVTATGKSKSVEGYPVAVGRVHSDQECDAFTYRRDGAVVSVFVGSGLDKTPDCDTAAHLAVAAVKRMSPSK